MNNKCCRYSIPEILGIIIMLVGIGLGYSSAYIGAHRANVVDENMDIFANPSTEISDMRKSMDVIMPSFTLDLRLTALSRGGIFTFLAGLGVFVAGRRRRWNKDLHENTKHTEQGGPGYPPQGVGSPER